MGKNKKYITINWYGFNNEYWTRFCSTNYIQTSTEKIKNVYIYIKKQKLHIDVGNDGGINKNNISDIILSGVNIIIILFFQIIFKIYKKILNYLKIY